MFQQTIDSVGNGTIVAAAVQLLGSVAVIAYALRGGRRIGFQPVHQPDRLQTYPTNRSGPATSGNQTARKQLRVLQVVGGMNRGGGGTNRGPGNDWSGEREPRWNGFSDPAKQGRGIGRAAE